MSAPACARCGLANVAAGRDAPPSSSALKVCWPAFSSSRTRIAARPSASPHASCTRSSIRPSHSSKTRRCRRSNRCRCSPGTSVGRYGSGGYDGARMLIGSVIAYLVVTIAIGLWAAQRVHTAKDYVVAGRSLPLYMNTATVFATWFGAEDRKSTRLNSSHLVISYAVFCLKKKNPGAGKTYPSSLLRPSPEPIPSSSVATGRPIAGCMRNAPSSTVIAAIHLPPSVGPTPVGTERHRDSVDYLREMLLEQGGGQAGVVGVTCEGVVGSVSEAEADYDGGERAGDPQQQDEFFFFKEAPPADFSPLPPPRAPPL